MKDRNALMTVTEAAELLGLSAGTLYHMVSEHRIPCVHLSARCLRFRRVDLDSWIAERVVKPDGLRTK